MTGHHTVSEKPVPVAENTGHLAAHDETVQFHERLRIEQQAQSFAGRELAPLVLGLETLLPTAQL